MGTAGRLAALLILALAACRSSEKGKTASPEDRPELEMHKLKVQSYGLAGLDWEMTAPVGKMYNTKSLMRVSGMKAQLYQRGERSTDIAADEGVMRTGNPNDPNAGAVDISGHKLEQGDMLLNGDVVVVSTDGNKLTTSWLQYERKANLIVSTAPVTMERADSVTKGVGMKATPDLSQVQIFNQTVVIREKPKAT